MSSQMLRDLMKGSRYALTGAAVGGMVGVCCETMSDMLLKLTFGQVEASEDGAESAIGYGLRIAMTGMGIVAGDYIMSFVQGEEADPTENFFMIWAMLSSQRRLLREETAVWSEVEDYLDIYVRDSDPDILNVPHGDTVKSIKSTGALKDQQVAR